MHFLKIFGLFLIGTLSVAALDQGEAIDGALREYFKIQIALVHGDDAAARKASQEFLTAIHHLPDVFEEYYTPTLVKISKDFIKAEGLEANRSHFLRMSLVMVDLLQQHGVHSVSAYQMRCECHQPYFPPEGAVWLQATDEIHNPYWGERMLHCGFPEAEYIAQPATPAPSEQ